MTEKRFTTKIFDLMYAIYTLIYDEGRFIDQEKVCDLLNELYEENEQLKKENKELKEQLKDCTKKTKEEIRKQKEENAIRWANI